MILWLRRPEPFRTSSAIRSGRPRAHHGRTRDTRLRRRACRYPAPGPPGAARLRCGRRWVDRDQHAVGFGPADLGARLCRPSHAPPARPACRRAAHDRHRVGLRLAPLLLAAAACRLRRHAQSVWRGCERLPAARTHAHRPTGFRPDAHRRLRPLQLRRRLRRRDRISCRWFARLARNGPANRDGDQRPLSALRRDRAGHLAALRGAAGQQDGAARLR